MMTQFTIPLPPVTKKNSPRAFIGRTTHRPIVLPSKQYAEYEANAAKYLTPLHIKQPVNIKAVYYMPTRRRVDKTNLESALMDVLVHCGVLEDDSALSPAIAVSTDGSRVRYDKLNPRTEIEIKFVNEDD
jgi:Holliday junction resolvase RusA-like endonuclease